MPTIAFDPIAHRLTPWRERVLTDPLAAALVTMGATDEEAADAYASAVADLRAAMARWVVNAGNPPTFAIRTAPKEYDWHLEDDERLP